MGHAAEMKALAGDITSMTIRDVGFSWKAGQHILLWCPELGLVESHPFTIANFPDNDETGPRKLELVIRARSGFTRRLHRRAASPGATSVMATVFLTGPFGSLPAWNTYETLVLISASTGASFTTPILESILKNPCCVSRVDCLLLVRDRSYIDGYLSRLLAAASHPRAEEISLRIMIAVTGGQGDSVCESDSGMELSSLSTSISSRLPSETLLKPEAKTREGCSLTAQSIAFGPDKDHPVEKGDKTGVATNEKSQGYHIKNAGGLLYTSGRPDISSIIQEPVEAAAGETSVVVCGGKSLTSTVRNCVASLSDERAVHKGTGAQGIHLHVEGFES